MFIQTLFVFFFKLVIILALEIIDINASEVQILLILLKTACKFLNIFLQQFCFVFSSLKKQF